MRALFRITTNAAALSTTLLATQIANAATPVFYNSRVTFEAATSNKITDSYNSPPYPAGFQVLSSAAMTAVLKETTYRSTGHNNVNILSGGTYCAGCNGSFELGFLSTSIGSATTGVKGAGLDVVSGSYVAYITFGDDTTSNVNLTAGFWGVTAVEGIKKIHFGLANGATTIQGSFQIDNLTIGMQCGNSVVDVGEMCDDGNNTGGDGCSADCKSNETCGNGIVDTSKGELCDDSNTAANDGCSANCKSNETCGNGIVDTSKGETCDDSNTTGGDGCSADCKSNETCGNGVVDTGKGEVCDDSNVMAGDGCSADCKSNETCGNGIIDTSKGEACDDSNKVDNDGCDSNCSLPACGNGIVNTGEVCDDMNKVSGDGCSATCASNETCGNGIVDTAKGEECDEAANNGKGMCTAMCKKVVVVPDAGAGDGGGSSSGGSSSGGSSSGGSSSGGSSSGSSGADAGIGAGGTAVDDGSGCSCTTGSNSASNGVVSLLGALAVSAVIRRKRNTKR